MEPNPQEVDRVLKGHAELFSAFRS
jgi:hypothetical protein